MRRSRQAKTERAPTLSTSTNTIRISDAAHALAWSAGSGDSEYVKIVTGRDATAWLASVVIAFGATEHVKRRGAVSPAARATPSTVPVMIPPIVCGSTTLTTVRQRATPSARLASRSDRGTRARTSWTEREMIGIIRIASANDHAYP